LPAVLAALPPATCVADRPPARPGGGGDGGWGAAGAGAAAAASAAYGSSERCAMAAQ
jgi:hypothetical protein